MASPAPQIQIAKPNKGNAVNGVLPVPASTIKQVPLKGGRKAGNKVVGPRLKVVIRRLPPGLTKLELDSALGDEWKVGAGRVDWHVYRPGKASQDPAKPSRPSRAYFHLTGQEHLTALSEKVHQTNLQDAQNTSNDPSLLGPPTVEFAAYGKVPTTGRRTDARQGTIDQDPEFIAFLESLTNPVSKPSATDSHAEDSKKEDASTVTPLIKFLKEKKASKGKDSASGKGSKNARSEGKSSRGERGAEKRSSAKGAKILAAQGRAGSKGAKTDDAAQKAVQVLNREATTIAKKGKPAPSSTGSGAEAKEAATTPKAPAAEKKRERGNASAAARMVQRDLGLGPGAGSRRGARKDGASATKGGTEPAKPATASTSGAPVDQNSSQTSTKSGNSKAPNERRPKKAAGADTSQRKESSGANPPTGPANPTAIMKKTKSGPNPGNDSTTAANGSTETAKPPPKAINAAAGTQAFLKHANPSQGVTVPLLQSAMEAFGPVTKVEIDEKKGFAYVEFGNADTLQKAMKSSPVKIAEGQVTVLERRERGPSGSSGAKGGRADRGRGGGGGGSGGGGRGGRGRGKGSGARGGTSGGQAPASAEAVKAPAGDSAGTG
ncbi:MAG: hypothetical protein M4579_001143 [Chaenotheca gracillima]|nr:MAG: hypothetical protein M4579_001143 [Chaenotheca gracillima]